MAGEPQRSSAGMLALRHPNRPTWLLSATLALGFFALEPFNLAMPVLGVIDDLFLLPLLLHGLAKIADYATTLPSTRSRDDRVVSVQYVPAEAMLPFVRGAALPATRVCFVHGQPGHVRSLATMPLAHVVAFVHAPHPHGLP